jgi:hypothetical protein
MGVESAFVELLRGFVVSYYNNMNTFIPTVLSVVFGVIALVGTHPVLVTNETGLFRVGIIYFRKFYFMSLVFLCILVPLCAYTISKIAFENDEVADNIINDSVDVLLSSWWIPLGFFILIGFWRAVFKRIVPTYISTLKRRYANRVSRDQPSDIRAETNAMKSKTFDVKKYYKEGFFFLGLDQENNPIYATDNEVKVNNIKAIGPTQTGKGVIQQMIVDQAIRKNWNVFFIDQKPDDFIPDIMREACEESERNLVTLDLTGQSTGSYCPFANGTDRERYTRFLLAAGLQDGGTDADFHKGAERAAISELMPLWDGSIKALDEFLNTSNSPIEKNLSEYKCKKMRSSLNKVSSSLIEWKFLKSINAKASRGFNVERTIKDNSVAIIRGSVSDKLVIKFTTIILKEIVDTILRVGKANKPEHTLLVIDEARFVITDELSKALATMLSKGCSTMISYQAIKDTENSDDKSVKETSIAQSINVNTKWTICYQAADFETAEWISKETGIVQKMVARMETVERNKHGGEEWTDNKTLNSLEEQFFTTNVAQSLPERVAIFIRGRELAVLLHTSWIPVKEIKGLPERTDSSKIIGDNNVNKKPNSKTKNANKPSKATSNNKNANEPSKATSDDKNANEPSKATSDDKSANEPSKATSDDKNANEPSKATSDDKNANEPSKATSDDKNANEPTKATLDAFLN